MEKEQWLFVYVCGIGVKPGVLCLWGKHWKAKLLSQPSFSLFLWDRPGVAEDHLEWSSCSGFLHDRHLGLHHLPTEMGIFSKLAQDKEEEDGGGYLQNERPGPGKKWNSSKYICLWIFYFRGKFRFHIFGIKKNSISKHMRWNENRKQWN